MSALSDFLTMGCKSLETDAGGLTFTYAGTSYLCVPNTLSKGNALEEGGKTYIVALALNVRQSLFGSTKPYAGKRLTFLTVSYRILSVESDGTGTNYTLHLGDPDK